MYMISLPNSLDLIIYPIINCIAKLYDSVNEIFASLQLLSSGNANKSFISMRACMRTLNIKT